MTRRLRVILCGAAVLCLLAVSGGTAGAAWNPPLLPTISSALAGRDVQVRCLDDGEWRSLVVARGAPDGPGTVALAGDAIEVRTSVCQVLLGFSVAQPHGPKPRTRAGFTVADYARFLGRLTARLRGVEDVREAECSALLSVQGVLERLGAEPPYARKLGGWLLDRTARSQRAIQPAPGCPVQLPQL
jgi:hypothetical protein